VEGRPDPGVKNYLRDTRSLHERLELGELLQSLIDHPGWAAMDEIVDELRTRGFESLASGSLPEYAAIAQRLGVQNGMAFHRDVVASALDSAKTAADELKRTADLEQAAEGTNS
jgi:hypothetical protein